MTTVPSPPPSIPQVTIVTPFYDTGSVFHETAQCVFAQTLHDFEWIIVNDGSRSREGLAVLAEYRNRDHRIRILDLPENLGLSAARNAGINASTSEYILFLDSDDLIHPTCAEKCLWTLETRPELSFCKGYTIGFGSQNYLWTKGFHNRAQLLTENLVDATVMIRREVALRIGGFDENRKGGLEDWDFWLRCAQAGAWGDTIHEPLNSYRRRDNHGERWSEFTKTRIEDFAKSIPERYPALNPANFPKPERPWHYPCAPIFDGIRIKNPRQSKGKHLVLILPQMEMGGADKWNLDLVERLIKDHEWHITVIATLPGQHRWRDRFEQHTKDIFVLDNFLDARDHPRFIKYLIESRAPDIVLFTNSQYGYSLAPFLKAHCPNIPFVDYVHMEEPYWRSGGYAMDSIRQSASFELTGVTSEHLRRWMSEHGGDPSKIKPVYINVNECHWNREKLDIPSLRNKWRIEPGSPVFLYPCRLVEQKQPDVFAKTVELILSRGANARFLIAGEGPMLSVITELTKRHPHHVRYLGPVSSEEIRELLALSDMLFIPSKMEGISLAYYEAMSMGVIPIGADVGGQIELVTPDCGILLKRNGDEALNYAESLTSLLADAPRLAEMKVACRKRIIENFTLDRMVTDMIALFEEAEARCKNGAAKPMPTDVALAYATEIVEQFRLAKLCDGLWSESDFEFKQRFRTSRISPKISKIKRGILRFLMNHL